MTTALAAMAAVTVKIPGGTSTVSVPLPAGQESTTASPFAASIASRSEQSPSTFSSSSVVLTMITAAWARAAVPSAAHRAMPQQSRARTHARDRLVMVTLSVGAAVW